MDKYTNIKIKLALKNKISEWLDERCENDDLDFYIPDDLVEHMCDAASAVLDTTIDLNEYFKDSGLLKE